MAGVMRLGVRPRIVKECTVLSACRSALISGPNKCLLACRRLARGHWGVSWGDAEDETEIRGDAGRVERVRYRESGPLAQGHLSLHSDVVAKEYNRGPFVRQVRPEEAGEFPSVLHFNSPNG